MTDHPTLLRRRKWTSVAGLLTAGLVIMAARDSAGQAPQRSAAPAAAAGPTDLVARTGRALGQALERWWPAHPESLSMLADILQGSTLGPQDGWFRKAVRQTRFPWEAVVKEYDADADGAVARSEFPGTDEDFRRLDRDRDGVLTQGDLSFPDHALAMSPGMMLFYLGDRDGNGKVTPEELDSLFQAGDPDAAGFLSLDDMKSLFTPPRSGGGAGPTRGTLVRGLFRQEIGSLRPGPSVGQRAPDFTLRTQDGSQEITLSERIGPRPMVLVFGNFTCGPFRMQAGNVEKLYHRYQDRADFLMIYVREAHPTDGWHMASNDRYGVTLPQPRTYDERVKVAQTCRKSLGFGMPFLVDTLDDEVGGAYSGMPSRLYVLDHAGRVAYKSGRGPFGFKPAEMEQALILLLADEARRSAAAAVPVGGAAEDAAEQPAAGRADQCRVPLLDNEEAWRRLPATENGAAPTLPSWARALAGSLPQTVAAMLELDFLYRTSEAFDPRLRARMRWVAARANRCHYAMESAAADLVRAGGAVDELPTGADALARLSDRERSALEFAETMTLAASTVTDQEMAFLIEEFGEAAVVAMVLQLAYANFQDRLLTTLDIPLESEGPLPPLQVDFPAATGESSAPAMRPPLPEIAEVADEGPSADADWLALPFDRLQELMENQRARASRVSIPVWEDFRDALDPQLYPPDRPTRIQWSLVVLGHQPQLGSAWIKCLRKFGGEANQDRVFEETVFWVITRSLQCFY